MKLVQIKRATGSQSLIVGGLMSEQTYLRYVSQYEPRYMMEAKHIWDTATLYSLKDYFGDVTIRVRKSQTINDFIGY